MIIEAPQLSPVMVKKVVIVGAGPTGALAAVYAAKRGYDVEVYELRDDIRKSEAAPLNFTKSINLALSERGINGLRSAGNNDLLDNILSQTIPMHGRMIHIKSAIGSLTEQSQAYDVHGRYQRSVDRGLLNICLLNELDRLPNVKLKYLHKLTGADFRKKKAWFEDRAELKPDSAERPSEIEVDFDLMLGCDGAHSAVRYHMMKFARMNYKQEYIDCLWCEFTMPPSPTGDFAISPNHLHIWPAGDSMFIALPNLDKSFVCTLFGPVSLFTALESSDSSSLIQTFNEQFPGIVPELISPSDFQAQFLRNPHLPLINIKCSPHHYSSTVAILGDAANAMVPFYGQGMNAGLESVRVLFESLDRFPNDQDRALSSYTSIRVKDAHAIADLALANYVEMRSSVTSPWYKLRKYIEERLYKYAPGLGWATQYSRVSFSNMRYSDVIAQSSHQKRVLQRVVASVATVSTGAVVYFALAAARKRQWLRR